MNIKLEIESLVDIGNDMVVCSRALTDIYDNLNSIHIDFWKGNGRSAFNQLLNDMRERSLSCMSRLGQSASVIGKALQKYNEIELDNAKANMSLPSDDIF